MTVKLELDQSAGVSLPTLVHAVVTLRGPAAESVGLAKTQGTKEQKDAAVGGLIGSLVGREFAIAGYTLAYDPTAAVATVDATGIVTTLWRRQDGRYRLVLDSSVSRMQFEPDRTRAAWRGIPVMTGAPTSFDLATRVNMPAGSGGVVLEGDATLSETLGGVHVQRVSRVTGNAITLDERDTQSGAEIAPADVQPARARVALAKTRLLTAVAAADTPTRWMIAERGRREGRFKPILAAYAKAIADSPEEASSYANRANFLLGIYSWREALPDLDRAIAIEPSVQLYLERMQVHRVLGDAAKARADAEAARQLAPDSYAALSLLGELDIDAGHKADAIARVEERINAGGDNKPAMLSMKAELLAYAGDSAGALATADEAVTAKPGSAAMLNTRCWVKAEVNAALDTAVKDCTKAIDTSDAGAAQFLDSRALAFFRMGKMNDAASDADAALGIYPELPSSLYTRGLIEARRGDGAASRRDIAAAATIDPLILANRKRFGLTP